METEERLASSGVPLRSRLKNESVRSYVLRLVGTAGRARRAAEMYLDIYEELRFTDAEISEAQYRDFLKLFAVVIDRYAPRCADVCRNRERFNVD